MPREQVRPGELPVPQEGVQIRFVNPELLRKYILEPNKPGKISFAERQAHVREIPLAKFRLDGALFESVDFSLLIEPQNPATGNRAPTAIIRADLTLGSDPSNLAMFQAAKANNASLPDQDQQENDYLRRVTETETFSGVDFVPWSPNTARVYARQAGESNWESDPMVLLQVWEKDAGPGSVAIALLTRGRYEISWRANYNAHRNLADKGWETPVDSSDDWNFLHPVGIPTHDPARFQRDIAFYEKAFAETIAALYKAEGRPVPHAEFEIEPPSILKDDNRVTFSDICGQAEAVEFLQAFANSEKLGRVLPRRPLVLLAGPPGNGKTSIVQAMANELEAPLLVATTRSLPPEAEDSHFTNLLEGGYMQAKAAARMKKGRAVYYIEAVEAMIGNNLRLQDRFLNMMEAWATDPDNDVLVIGTTNFPERLHPGITSRFRKFDILPPKRQDIVTIITILAGKLGKQIGRNGVLGDADLITVATRLEAAGFSGRDVLNFLTSTYHIRRQESQEAGHWLPMDTKFLLKHAPEVRRIGFQT